MKKQSLRLRLDRETLIPLQNNVLETIHGGFTSGGNDDHGHAGHDGHDAHVLRRAP
ncbi:MAG: hypothetical protein ACKV2T_35865 [Kofleriaceae bacterium]